MCPTSSKIRLVFLYELFLDVPRFLQMYLPSNPSMYPSPGPVFKHHFGGSLESEKLTLCQVQRKRETERKREEKKSPFRSRDHDIIDLQRYRTRCQNKEQKKIDK